MRFGENWNVFSTKVKLLKNCNYGFQFWDFWWDFQYIHYLITKIRNCVKNAHFNVKTSSLCKLRLNATIELTSNNINRQQRKQRINATICGFVRENSTHTNPQHSTTYHLWICNHVVEDNDDVEAIAIATSERLKRPHNGSDGRQP